MRVCTLLILVSGLAGCMTYDVRPDSRVDVRTAYAEREITTGSLAVVIDRDSVRVDDGGVSAHVGPGDPVETYVAFFAQQLPGWFRMQTTLDSVVVGEADPFEADASGAPVPGAVVTVAGARPDYVLFVRTLRVFRAGYQSGGGMFGGAMGAGGGPGMMMGGGSRQMAVRNDADVVLWDNTTGREVSAGRIESHDEYLFIRRDIYEGAVGEFVEQVVYRTPIAKRRD